MLGLKVRISNPTHETPCGQWVVVLKLLGNFGA
ncbi:hypothetical protein SODG_004780 [Sodalis praecaptivus]